MPHHSFCQSQDCLALKLSSDAAAGVTLANGMERKFINGSKPFYSQYTIKNVTEAHLSLHSKGAMHFNQFNELTVDELFFNFLFTFFLGIPGNCENFRVSCSRFQIPDSRIPNFLFSWIVFGCLTDNTSMYPESDILSSYDNF